MRKRVDAASSNLDWTVRLVWLSPLISLVVGAPVMAVVLPLRFAGVLSWEVEAITWPWGRRGGPATVMRWRVKGWSQASRVVDELAGALEEGNTQPQISGAEREK